MYIIAGLGNPGKKYENTRHNMGFLAVDLLAEKYDIRIDKIKFKALVGEGRIAGQKVLLVKPQTFMNLSGQSIVEIMNFYKEDVENLIVIYDDIDNIVYLLGNDGFPRIRVGIGATDGKQRDLINYVIGGVSKADVKPLEEALTQAAAGAVCIVEKGIDKAMNAYNTKSKKPKREKQPAEDAPQEADAESQGEAVTKEVTSHD